MQVKQTQTADAAVTSGSRVFSSVFTRLGLATLNSTVTHFLKLSAQLE